LTDQDRELAEDLLATTPHSFSFAQKTFNAIHNLEGYLYGMLRNLHLSQERTRQSQSLRTGFR